VLGTFCPPRELCTYIILARSSGVVTMTLRHYRRELDSVFCILGNSENAITESIAWVLSQCPTFLFTFLHTLTPDMKVGALQVATQSFSGDRGFTDIEIYEDKVVHVIVEAKKGFWLPQENQFRRYLPRFQQTQAPPHGRFLVSMSEATEVYAGLHLPQDVDEVPLKHLSWRQTLRLVGDSYAKTGSFDEKRWLGQLSLFLGGIATMQNQGSNEVFVVVLSRDEILPNSGYTWIDVVEKDGNYFHPVGNGWPAEPPNYVGFRYDGRLQSVHHVESYEVVRNLQARNKNWPATSQETKRSRPPHDPHFVYTLGKPMRPASPIRTGKIFRNGRVKCAIDTLLSGEFDTIADARDASKRRIAELADPTPSGIAE